MLRGLQFEPWVAPVPHWRNRMDVACFIGYSRRRAGTALPPSVLQWLREEGFIDAPGQPSTLRDAGVESIVGGTENLPIAIDDWSMFERLFEIRTSTLDGETPRRSPGYLAAAVRSFFAQGGRRCIVIALEQPADLHLRSAPERRLDAIGALVPEYADDVDAMAPVTRGRWRGLGLLHGLDDVAIVCLPDLPWLVGQVPERLVAEDPVVPPQDTFFECATALPVVEERSPPPPVAIGRCDQPEYLAWAAAVRIVSSFLAKYRRDVQFIAALPLPARGSRAERDPIHALLAWGVLERGDEGGGAPSDDGVGSRFLQLAYPWLRWPGSQGLPENLEAPDGALAGVIARSTLLRGAFRTASGQPLYDIEGLEPGLSRAQREREPDVIPVTGAPNDGSLEARMSLIGQALRRFEVLSDVTSSGDEAYQLANIQRLHAVWIRALGQAGHPVVFESSNEDTWAQVRRQLTDVGMALYRGGALRGDSPQQAFNVRCDRTTMSQRDIDAGRLIAEIQYRPAAPLELIRVFLALSENREVTVLSEAAEVPA
jgi:hypothetical protein